MAPFGVAVFLRCRGVLEAQAAEGRVFRYRKLARMRKVYDRLVK